MAAGDRSPGAVGGGRFCAAGCRRMGAAIAFTPFVETRIERASGTSYRIVDSRSCGAIFIGTAEQRRHLIKMTPNLSRKIAVESLDGRDLVNACLVDPFEAAEMPQHRPPPRRPYTIDVIEHRAQSRAPAQFAIVGNRKTMGFIANPHQHEE